VLPEFGENIRRTSQATTDALLEEHADIEASDPGANPPPPPPPPGAPERERSGRGWLEIVPPVLLAALGLVAAVIAWRVGVAGNIADDANRAGIEATRQRALTLIQDEGRTARSMDAFLDFSRAEQRADLLSRANVDDQAQANRMAAIAHYGFVDTQYVDRNGEFQPDQERAALLAGAEQDVDIQPLAHFNTADAAYVHLDGLILAGIVVALALPFLTLAEVGRGRLRGFAILIGTGIFGAGVVLAVLAWV
jgi:hypothetical protein